MGGTIFICYRRGEDAAAAGRLYDRLEHTFGPQRLFMDVDNIPPGEDFVAVLQAQVAACDILLAIIGRGWLTATDKTGRSRLENPEDFVRIEIASGLAQGKRVIPVLVDDATMPGANQLPTDLIPLAWRQAVRIAHDRFKDDAERLTRVLKKALAETKHQAEERKRQLAEAEAQREAEARRQAEEDKRKTQPQAERRDGEKKKGILRVDLPLPKTLAGLMKLLLASTSAVVGLALVVGITLYRPGPDEISGPPKPPATDPSIGANGQVAKGTPIAKDALVANDAPVPFQDCDVCPPMVALSGGTFTMGSPTNERHRRDYEGPQRQMTIKPFAIGKYEVTFAEWDACVAAGGCNDYRPADSGAESRESQPVINVSWQDAQAYVSWLSKQTSKTYRLPTEAEWEYAARAGTATPFSFGSTINTAQANYDGRYTYGPSGARGGYRQQTVPVGHLAENPWGLGEVHGNVWEWVEDCWHDGYEGAPQDGRAWVEASCTNRVLRGGSWKNRPRDLRSASRNRGRPDDRYYDLGFRVARSLSP